MRGVAKIKNLCSVRPMKGNYSPSRLNAKMVLRRHTTEAPDARVAFLAMNNLKGRIGTTADHTLISRLSNQLRVYLGLDDSVLDESAFKEKLLAESVPLAEVLKQLEKVRIDNANDLVRWWNSEGAVRYAMTTQ